MRSSLLFSFVTAHGATSAAVAQAGLDLREQTERGPVKLGPTSSHHRDETVVDETRRRHRHGRVRLPPTRAEHP